MFKPPARRGYTLIEVLVVAAIMALLFAVGIASYARFDRKRRIETTAMEFASYLRKTQKRADSGELSSLCGGALNGIQVKVEVMVNDTKATDELVCPIPPSKGIFNTQSGVSFVDDFNATFMTVGRGVNNVDGDVTITDGFGTANYKVEVTSGGAITVQEI